MPAGGFLRGCLEIEEILAEEAKEESHGGDEEEKEEGEEDFADDLAELEAGGHATPIESAKPVWAERGEGDRKERQSGHRDLNGIMEQSLPPEHPEDGVDGDPGDGGKLDPFDGLFLECFGGLYL